MFFILSKTVAFLLLPSNFLIALCFLGLLLLATRYRHAGLRIVATGLVLLAIAGFLPLGVLVTHELESRFPPWDAARGAPDGIIILGGAISPQLSRAYGQVSVSSDAGRLIAIGRLAREYPNARIVYSGGDSSLLANRPAEADYVYLLLDDLGVARTRVALEAKSRNTYENAVFTKALMQPKPNERWLLVTSAQHMPRAIGCFRQAGFPVEAYPVAWHTNRRVNLWPRDVASGGLSRLDDAAREWIGLIAYWITGKTSAFLPEP